MGLLSPHGSEAIDLLTHQLEQTYKRKYCLSSHDTFLQGAQECQKVRIHVHFFIEQEGVTGTNLIF